MRLMIYEWVGFLGIDGLDMDIGWIYWIYGSYG